MDVNYKRLRVLLNIQDYASSFFGRSENTYLHFVTRNSVLHDKQKEMNF
jgi:hypothetical protein